MIEKCRQMSLTRVAECCLPRDHEPADEHHWHPADQFIAEAGMLNLGNRRAYCPVFIQHVTDAKFEELSGVGA